MLQPTDQRAAWNGREGASWAEQSARRLPDGDLVADVLAAAAIEPGERVLDVGCGTGDLTVRAARRATTGDALGVDLSSLMIAEARDRAAAEEVGNVAFEVGDVQEHRFEPGARDVVVSHFGVMFFDDAPAAFANLRSSLRPGGRIVFACPAQMERCDWYGVPLAALHRRRPSSEEAPSAMFSLSDPAVLSATLGRAGFVGVEIEELPGTFWFGPDPVAAADTFLGTGPVRAFLERHPHVHAIDARDAIAAAVTPYLHADGVRLPGAHWLVRGMRQGAR